MEKKKTSFLLTSCFQAGRNYGADGFVEEGEGSRLRGGDDGITRVQHTRTHIKRAHVTVKKREEEREDKQKHNEYISSLFLPGFVCAEVIAQFVCIISERRDSARGYI